MGAWAGIDASGSFHPGADAPPGDEGVGERRVTEVDRKRHSARRECPKAS
jgi:hypothetical protein